MKYILILSVVFLLAPGAKAQTTAEFLADRIAQRLKDSLQLTQGQKDSLYQVNLALHNQKQAIRQQYTAMDSVRAKLQLVENMRDSLYRPVLTQGQYQLYRQRKRNLVSAN